LEILIFKLPPSPPPTSFFPSSKIKALTLAHFVPAVLLPFYPGSLACGNTFTCGLQSTGQAFCWGDDNSYGQLGTNATTGTIPPVPISGNGSYIKLSAGSSTACGIQKDLTGWCWGLNDQGQAGAFNQTQPVGASLFRPTQIYGNQTWLELAVGSTFACGINTNRSLYCWGSSYTGALGLGQLNSTVLIPQQIQLRLNSSINQDVIKWNKVGCGYDFACAISTNGSLYCWGNNEFGQTGTGATTGDSLVRPTFVPIPEDQYTGGDSSIYAWDDLFIGSNSLFAFATQSDGTAYSWGDGREGTLAIDEITVSMEPQQMLTTESWNYIAGGTSQVLGIANNLQGFAWGAGFQGQLGTGGIINATAGPIKIYAFDPQGASWSAMCANTEQSCGIYNDAAYCWGASASGLLGSSGGDTSIPRLVQGGKGVKWGVRPLSPPPAPLLPSPPPPPRPNEPPNAPKHPPPPPIKPAQSNGASIGEIVGAAIGGIALASVLLVGFMVWRRKRKQKRARLLGIDNKNNNNTGSNAKPDAVLLWAAHSQEIESPRSSLMKLIPATLAPLEFIWNDVEVLKPLGTGSFGQVYLANINHTKMAVKVLVDADAVVAAAAAASVATSKHTESATSNNPGAVDGNNNSVSKGENGGISTSTTSFKATSLVPKAHIEKMLQEASLMASLQHPNVVHLLGFCISPPCMAVEYCPRGSLYDVLEQACTDPESAKRLSWIRRLNMAKQTSAGLLHLHTRVPPILHRDVKSPNILVAADFTVKIADMGLSKLAEDVQGAGKISTMGGGANPRWLAPEVLGGQKASKESDVFAFGVVLWEILTYRLPWSEDNVWLVSFYLALLYFYGLTAAVRLKIY
jgi:alpha-tubulin suppressor-like RCC1 family protein